MSLRLRLFRGVMRYGLKPLLRRARGVGGARAGLVAVSLLFPPPLGVGRRREVIGGVPCLRLTGRDGAAGPVLLWMHGGAHVAGSAFTHRAMVGRMIRAAGGQAVLPDYRRAPEHPAPAGHEDGVRVLEALWAAGVAPGRIVLGGDSAGGGLAAALLAEAEARGKPPGGVVLLSPWADLTLAGASVRGNAAREPLLPAERMPEMAGLVRGDLDLADPRLSPVFARWAGSCPALICVGSTEILLDDSLRLAEAMRQAGARVDLVRQPGAPHVLAYLAPWVPEARAEIRRIAAFLRSL